MYICIQMHILYASVLHTYIISLFLHTHLISLLFISLPGVRAKNGQLSVQNPPSSLAWTALFLSLMVPSFPLWGYWVMYCSFKTFLRLPSNNHTHSPPVWRGWALHTDCLFQPVSSTGPKGQPKGCASFPRIKKRLQVRLFFIFPISFLGFSSGSHCSVVLYKVQRDSCLKPL